MGHSPPPPDLLLPRPRRWSRAAIATSVAIHALLLFVGWVEGRLPIEVRAPERLVVLTPPADAPDFVGRPGFPRARATGPAIRHGARAVPRSTLGPHPQPTPPPASVAPAAAPDTAPPPDAGYGRVGPGLARGKLWTSPLPLPPQELAQRVTKSHVQLVDSAVTVAVQAFLDSIAKEPGADRVALPSWTKQIAGKMFGIDSRNIYIAGLRIPAVILGLLPLHGSGNIDQNRAYSHLQDLRADLQRAATRSETVDEFKRAVKELRTEKERQHALETNQRLSPDSTAALVPSP